MIKTISTILILFSSAASTYYSFGGVIKSETAVVYNKANMSRLGIQLLSLFLGVGGLLLLLPQTFKIGGTMLMIHSLITVICFTVIKDWKGVFFEFLFLQIPIFVLWAGYPL
jgi:hypothetical protein